MTAHKTPILLRESPLTKRIMALTRYTRKGDLIEVHTDGKHDVTADFDAIVLEHLLDPDCGDICAQLDGAARGMKLTKKDRQEVKRFRKRLIVIIKRHNKEGHGCVTS